MHNRRIGITVALIGLLACWTATAGAQTPTADTAATINAETAPVSVSTDAPGPDYAQLLRPVFGPTAMLWFGGTLWLVLGIDLRRFLSLRTIDVLSIVGLAILLVFRHDNRGVTFFGTECTYALLAWTGIFAICAYLLLRTLGQLLRRTPRVMAAPGIGPTAWLLLAFAVSANFCGLSEWHADTESIALARGSRHLLTTGQMPYGQIANRTDFGPTLYQLHAGRMDPQGSEADDLGVTKSIGALAHAAILLGLVLLGWQMHNASTGALLAALYALFPPVGVMVATAHLTVPAALVIWALVAMAPRLRSIGAAIAGALLAVASGMMFYPLLLAPAFLASCLRRRGVYSPVMPPPNPHGSHLRGRNFGALTFIVAFVGVGSLLDWRTLSATTSLPPRSDAIQAALCESPSVLQELGRTNGQWTLTPVVPIATRPTPPGAKCAATRCLAWLAADGNPDDEPVLSASALQAIGAEAWDAAGVTTRPATIATDGANVPLRRIRPADAEAARVLATLYDHAAVDYSWWRQTVAKGRTIVEAAWFDGRQTADDAGSPRESSAWQQWQRRQQTLFDAGQPLLKERTAWLDRARDYVLLGQIGLAAAAFFLLLLFKSRCTPWHLCAVSAAIVTGTQLWPLHGGGTAIPWFLPLVVVALLVSRAPDPPPSNPLMAAALEARMRH
ncbi:MAG: hypothetical protein JXA69_03265 [Phycisphaerae bacterium]|nr:hypothetical protein [Phycisphaerae bacterium]